MEETSSPPPKTSPGQRQFAWLVARRLLVSIAVLATVVTAFYTEENWRGKRAWEKCRQELEARGAVFDWATRIPPRVPEEENFFSAPGMADWFEGKGKNDLSRRLENPKTQSVGGESGNAIQTEIEARDYLAWSDQFLPDFDEVRIALKRPYARIDCDYGQPMTVLVPNFLTIRSVVQTLAQRTHCFLLLNEPEKALGELTFMHDLCRILQAAPTGKPITLVGAMINVAVTGLYADSVAEGFRSHEWGEPQLLILEQQFGEIHLEKGIAETLIDEPMFALRTLEISSRKELANLLFDANDRSTRALLVRYAPRGWLHQCMVTHARLNAMFSSGFDETEQKVTPRKIDEGGRVLLRNVQHDSPYTFLSSVITPNWVKGLQKFAANQTIANEGAVACALERYHLVHSEYPETLNALVPQFIEKLPHDMVGGGQLKYQRIGASQFLLYSLGWNETDDAGVPGKTIADGDWVWGRSTQATLR